MAVVGQDTFTEGSNTALQSHTPDTGAGWTLQANQFTVIAASDELRHDSTNIERARKGDSIGDDNMVVRARVKVGNAANRRAGLCARMSTDNFDNQYEAYLQRNSGTQQDLLLFKNVGGTRTQLGSTVTISLNADTYIHLRLTIGTGTQIVATSPDGSTWTDRISTTEADATLAGRQYAGLIMNGNSTLTTALDDFLSESVVTAYTLTAEAGSYALTGSTVALKVGRKLAAGAGSYALNGSAVALKAGRQLAAGAGSYTLAGQAVTLTHGTSGAFTLAADAGSYVLNGGTVGLRAARRISAEAGAYAFVGANVALKAGRTIAMAAGSYALTGAAVTLQRGRRLAADSGSYALAGSAVGLRAGRRLSAAAGAYALAGQAVTLSVGSVGPRITMGPGAYLFSGLNVNLTGPPTLAGYATLDIDAFANQWEGRLEGGLDLEISRTLPDVFFRDVAEPKVTIRLRNPEGRLTPAYASATGTRLHLQRYDLVSGALASRLRSKVSWPKLDEYSLELDCAVLDQDAFAQMIPAPKVDTATWPNAVDVGRTIPVVLGNVPDVPLPYVNDDRVNSLFDYLVGHGTLAVTGLSRNVPGSEVSKFKDIAFSECVRAAGGAATSWSEVTRTDLYPGYTVIRFIKRQGINANADGGLHTIYADVTGLQTERNFVQAVATVLGNTTWGLGRAVNAASVTATAAALPAGLVCDGAMLEPRRARDVLGDLCMARGIRFELNDDGEITFTLDAPRNQIGLHISDDPGDGPRNRAASGPRVGPAPEARVKELVLRYRQNPITGEYLFPQRRTVNPTGLVKEIEHPFVRNHTTADMIADYLGKKLKYGQETIEVTVTQEGSGLGVGDLVMLTKASQGYDGTVLEIQRIAERLTSLRLTLQGYHWSTYLYEPGTLPADAATGTETDYSRTAPSTPSTPTISASGARTSGDGHVSAWVTLSWTNPSSNFSEARVRYRINGTSAWITGNTNRTPGATTATIEGLLPNAVGSSAVAYDYSIEAVNAPGNLSATSGTLSNQPSAADASVPNAPTGLAAISHLKGNLLTWTSIAEADVRKGGAIRVWRNTTNNSGTATELTAQRVAGDSHAIWDPTGTYGQVYHYWVRAQDSAGNLSAFSSNVSTTPTKVATGDVGSAQITGTEIGTGGSGVATANVNTDAVTKVSRATFVSPTSINGDDGEVDVNGATVTFTATGGPVLIIAFAPAAVNCTGAARLVTGLLTLKRGSTDLVSDEASIRLSSSDPAFGWGSSIVWVDTPSAGSVTYKLTMEVIAPFGGGDDDEILMGLPTGGVISAIEIKR